MIQFYNYITMYESIGRALKSRKGFSKRPLSNEEEFYKFFFSKPDSKNGFFQYMSASGTMDANSLMSEMSSLMMQALSEIEYYRCQSPYFCLLPSAINVFKKIPFNIPVSEIKFPFDLPTFTIRFPAEGQLVQIGSYRLRSVFCFRPKGVRLAKIQNEWKIDGQYIPDGLTAKKTDRIIIALDFIDTNQSDEERLPLHSYYQLIWGNREDMLIGSTIGVEKNAIGVQKFSIQSKLMEIAVKMMMGTCALVAQGDSKVLPDVLPEDRLKVNQLLDKNLVSATYDLQRKFIQQGKLGWIVGQHRFET